MNAIARRLPSRGLVIGTLLALAVGIGGSWAALRLLEMVDGEPARAFAILAAGFVIGGVGGAFGRGLVGLLALWVGVLGARTLGFGLEAPDVALAELVDPVVTALAITGAGYIVGRVVDPIWDGRAT